MLVVSVWVLVCWMVFSLCTLFWVVVCLAGLFWLDCYLVLIVYWLIVVDLLWFGCGVLL